MGYASKRLNKDEKIIYTGRLSWACVIVGIFWFPILGFFKRLLGRATTELTLTNSRVVGKAGIIKSISCDVKLEKVQNVTVSSGLGGKIFGYGNISVADASGEKWIFRNIGGAEKLKQKIMAQIDISKEEATKKQAQEMAAAMAAAIKS